MPRKPKFNKQQAIEDVMHAMWENGYNNSSVKAISEMLGITRSSFYHAFGSREQLFKEVMTCYETFDPLTEVMNVNKGFNIKSLITNYFKQLCNLRASDEQHKGCLSINSMAELCANWSSIKDDDYEYMATNDHIYTQQKNQDSDKAGEHFIKAQDHSPVVLAVLMRDKLEFSNEHFEKLLSWAKEQGEIDQDIEITSLALAITNLNIGVNTMSKIVHEESRLWEAAKTTLSGLGLLSD